VVDGFIDRIDGLFVYGWSGSSNSDLDEQDIIIKLDGIPMQVKISWHERVDINEHLGRCGNFGFVAEVIGAPTRGSIIELYSCNEVGEFKVDVQEGDFIFNQPRSLSCLELLKDISRKEDAIAITIWDCTHNPIGRAKVLYDIVKDKRPSCIIGFDFQFSKSKLWEPIANLDIPIISIPWELRAEFKKFVEYNDIYFETVWLCKPRLPSVWLASSISKNETKVIVDVDDNEAHLSNSKGSRNKPYGTLANSQVKGVLNQCPSYTCASSTLQEQFGGLIVRHARKDLTREIKRPFSGETIKLGFIGTVRPHKGVLQAAKVIGQHDSLSSVIYTVGGMFNPKSLEQDLEDLGGECIGFVPQENLYSTIETFDIVITGFPSGNKGDDEITRYQISSKIGDALSCGRPVMVPYSPSVADLDGVPGIYLFDEYNFVEVLEGIINEKPQVTFGEDFSLDLAYRRFEEAEVIASSKTADKISGFLGLSSTLSDLTQVANLDVSKEKIVVFWKQFDAGVYGRRVDIVARDLKQNFPNKEVIVIELVHAEHEKSLEKRAQDPKASAQLTLNRVFQKDVGLYLNGVHYKTLHSRSFSMFPEELEKLLLVNNILPSNSNVLLFPLIQGWREVLPILSNYRITVDMVDNQMSWASSPKAVVGFKTQYLSVLSLAGSVIYNSEENKSEFESLAHEFVPELAEKSTLIPNWYSLPSTFQQPKTQCIEKRVVYSGNLNDRIDWKLLGLVASVIEEHGGELIIIGDTERVSDNIYELVENKCVTYTGPLIETSCLRVLSESAFAIMPHLIDGTSKFMNPLKVKMYESIGLPCISTNVPGIEKSDLLSIAKSRMEFVNCVERWLIDLPKRSDSLEATNNVSIDSYVKHIF